MGRHFLPDPTSNVLKSWDIEYFTPGVFKEMMKRTLDINMNPKQLAAVISQFDTKGNNSVDTKKFLTYYTRLGKELRQMDKQMHNERQREYEYKREKEAERKKKMANL